MIERQDGAIQFVCDACPEALETDSRDFNEANAARRREGWAAEQIGKDWVHLCPACRDRPRR